MASPTRGVEARSAAIADAAMSILANEGWGALTANAVAREVGCTVATVRARATSRVDLARMAWERRIAARFVADLEFVSDAAETFARSGDSEPLVLAWSRMTHRTLESDAAMELLVIAHTNPEVAAMIDTDISDVFAPRPEDDPVTRLQRLGPLSFAMGLLVTNRHPWAQDRGLRQALTTRTKSYARIYPSAGAPEDVEQYLTWVDVLDDVDPALNSLLLATTSLIAQRGADDITVQEIAAAAGATEGLVFSRYPTKLALVADALHRHSVRMWDSMAQTGMRTSMRFDPATAGVVYDTQFLHPSRRDLRVVNLEQARVSWHHTPLLMDAIERITAFRKTMGELPGWAQLQADLDFFLDFATGTGIMLLARLVPEAGELPWRSISEARAEELFNR